ncbi:MAG: VTT domain-containing protein, partial [Desulfovibrionaceae bacterium]|nr:VTT domain-containing protein [Desulfovibrionaceae bacterium]
TLSYFIFYVFISSLPMPGAMTLALLCGVIMGFIPALILVSFASAVGACCSMLIARYLFRDIIIHKFQSLYCKVQKGFQEDGFLYIIFLRLLPIPFFIVNIMLGLTPVSVYMYYIASQIGLFPTLFLIVKAGAELGLIESPQEIFSPTIIALFVLMAIFPFLIKKIFFLFYKKSPELEL